MAGESDCRFHRWGSHRSVRDGLNPSPKLRKAAPRPAHDHAPSGADKGDGQMMRLIIELALILIIVLAFVVIYIDRKEPK